MSSDPWGDDYVPQPAQSTESVGLAAGRFEIEDATARGTTYKPQIKILRREPKAEPEPEPAKSSTQGLQRSSGSSLSLHEQLKERERNYMKIREKILGKDAYDDVQPPRRAGSDSDAQPSTGPASVQSRPSTGGPGPHNRNTQRRPDSATPTNTVMPRRGDAQTRRSRGDSSPQSQQSRRNNGSHSKRNDSQQSTKHSEGSQTRRDAARRPGGSHPKRGDSNSPNLTPRQGQGQDAPPRRSRR